MLYRNIPAGLAVFASFSLFAGGEFENPLARYLEQGVLNVKESAESPRMFDENGRRLRWNNVLRTNQPCPSYESWRTRPGEKPDGRHELTMKFTRPVPVGTLLAFADDRPERTFRVSADQPGRTVGTGATVSCFERPVSTIRFTAEHLEPAIVENWGSRKELSGPIASYNLALLGIYALEQPRVNIAGAATPQVSGVHRLREAELLRVTPEGVADGSTYTFWRSGEAAPERPAELLLNFPRPVKIRELALYCGNDSYSDMPARAETEYSGGGVFKPFGVFDSFDNHPHRGRHFYLIKNPAPAEAVTSLRLRLTPREGRKYVALTEILVLAAPGDNPELRPRAAKEFARNWRIERDGAVFAGGRIEDAAGKPVKTLAPVLAQNGRFTFTWDGTDDAGQVVAPGRYVLRGATRGKLALEYESTPYSPAATPWVTPSRRGGWLSDHAAASSIEQLDGKLWIGAQIAEAGDTIMQLDGEGRKLWGVRWLNLAGAAILRPFGGKLFVASGGGWIGNKVVVSELDPQTRRFKTLLSHDFPPELSGKKSHFISPLTGFAAGAEYLAVAMRQLNRIELFDRNGKKVRDLTVPEPGALRFAADGRLLAVSRNAIVSVDPVSAKTAAVIPAGLVAPSDFALLPDGYLVCDAGANLVRRFDSHGTPVRTYGSGEPRRAGIFDNNVIHSPAAAALDDRGRLWVAESGDLPKRISVWDARTGGFIRDFLGPARYEASAFPDPADHNTAFAEGMTFRRDEDGPSWKLHSVYEDRENPTYMMLKAGKMPPERPFRLNGRLYLARDRHWTAPVQFFGEIGSDGVLQPRAALGGYAVIEQAFKEKPQGYSGNPKEYTFLWNDANGNGRMEWEELAFDRAAFSVLEWNCRFGDKLEFYYYRNNREVAKLAPRFENGRPVYRWEDRKTVYRFPAPVRIVAISPLGSGRVLLNTSPDLICVEEVSGKVLWRYANPHPSNRHDSPQPKEGEILHTLNIEGRVELPGFGEVFLLNGNKGVRYLFSSDGIYLGRLFADQRTAPPLAFDDLRPGRDLIGYSLMDEAFCGSFGRCNDGAIRFSGGKNHHSISVLKNLESLREFKVPFTFGAGERKQALESRAGRLERERAMQRRDELTLVERSAPIPLRGRPEEWQAIPAAVFRDGGEERFTVSLAMDSANLYGAFRVRDDSPFVNRGDDEKLLFKTGDSVNLELGSHREAAPRPEDVRLLIAPFRGKPAAVLYRYRVPGARQPQEFISPIGRATVDQVEVLDDAEVRVTPVPGGYFLEFRIPRRHLPVLNRKAVFGDAGVIFSDAAGTINRYNAFFHSTQKGVTADVPSEIRLLPQQWQPIRIIRQ